MAPQCKRKQRLHASLVNLNHFKIHMRLVFCVSSLCVLITSAAVVQDPTQDSQDLLSVDMDGLPLHNKVAHELVDEQFGYDMSQQEQPKAWSSVQDSIGSADHSTDKVCLILSDCFGLTQRNLNCTHPYFLRIPYHSRRSQVGGTKA